MKKHISTYITIMLFSSMLFGQGEDQFSKNHQDIHKFIAQDVLQTTSYTYLLANENEKLRWVAIPKMDPNEKGE